MSHPQRFGMEQISVFDMFKVGVGPSSSHTMGPWKAALDLLKLIGDQPVKSIQVKLYGSLSKTGIGHGTDKAVILGLMGHDPITIDTTAINRYVETVQSSKMITLGTGREIAFDPESQIVFAKQFLPRHPNALRFTVALPRGKAIKQTYYSIGGGFIQKEGEEPANSVEGTFPYPCSQEAHLLEWIKKENLSIDQLVWANEISLRPPEEVDQKLLEIWDHMLDSIYRGCHQFGVLPGGLEVRRRAGPLNQKLLSAAKTSSRDEWMETIKRSETSFATINKWVSCFALAVNEENAAFGRVVTAPTNGAAGVIPAVLMYHLCFCENQGNEDIKRFLLTASEIGSLYKKGSTISAAMGGCQAEIGVSSSMAAAGLTACMDGSPQQVLMAAEIAMEHHLGMTCDPIKGLVQIPCIERNTMGAIKAITASQLALSGDHEFSKVKLDGIIRTMWATAQDMHRKYKETSEGGLAKNIEQMLPEC